MTMIMLLVDLGYNIAMIRCMLSDKNHRPRPLPALGVIISLTGVFMNLRIRTKLHMLLTVG